MAAADPGGEPKDVVSLPFLLKGRNERASGPALENLSECARRSSKLTVHVPPPRKQLQSTLWQAN